MIRLHFITSKCRFLRLQCRNYTFRPIERRYDPLRILFCGSDQFSITSLEALHKLMKQDGNLIQSIDVLCRTDKRVGRGLKALNQVPIKIAAQELHLPVHQIDTFKNWTLPAPRQSLNLIVAVSFGLLIPSTLISSIKYGGINVHPSLLPDLRGAAPIHHALLLRRPITGVSIQTLHPTKFDHGQILDQVEHPLDDNMTFKGIRADLAVKGAELLASVVQSGSFVPPISTISRTEDEINAATGGQGLAKAPKLQKPDFKIDWSSMPAEDILLRWRVFGQLWDDTILDNPDQSKAGTRVIFNELGNTSHLNIDPDVLRSVQIGSSFLHRQSGKTHLIVRAANDSFVEVLACNFAGDSRQGGGSLDKFKDMIRSKQRD